MAQLDDDSLYLIFGKLNSKVDQNSFGLTCHTFLDIQSSSTKCLKIGCVNKSNCSTHAIIDFAVIDKLFNRYKQLETLTLGSCLKLPDSCLKSLERYGSKIHSLHLDFCHPPVTDIGLYAIASGCPSLSYISLASANISDRGLEILTNSCTSLKEVNLLMCFQITDRGISYLNRNCRQLIALTITHCRNILGTGFEGCSPTLTRLEANNCKFDSMTVVSGIVSGRGLEYLNLAKSLLHPLTILAPIGLGFASKLKILNLAKSSFVEDDAIIYISRGCPLLQEWNLSYCNKIGFRAWSSIGLHCQNLEVLDASYCDNLCDRGFLALAAGCKRLAVIFIKNCGCLTPYELQLFRLQRKDVEIKIQ